MADESAEWWQGAIIYHIYPRSFQDSTGNGIGDLRGIEQRLDYIAQLGVDAIWISPFAKSPMRDFGYDVSDYLSVDPLFGSLEDFQSLLKAAHDRGLKVMMDQVLSHTSSEHPWFLASREGRGNAKADWYVWSDPAPGGAPPNNWLSVFGGSSWQWEPRRGQYYLHNFLRDQPDLNYHCEDVQQAVLDVCRFWLEMGVDGFRLDVCAFYFHDPSLIDNPPAEAPQGSHFMFNPYSLQEHRHDIAQPENLQFLEKLRALADEYDDRVLLGELHQSDGEALHHAYTGPDRLQLAYGYWLLGADELNAETIRKTATDLRFGPDDGWPCWALDNHDFHRAVSRLGVEESPDAALIALIALTCMRGATCLYQGSELGLPNADVPYEDLLDPYGREFYPSFIGRDGARTPMPWDAEKPHAGFSEAKPWLPVTEPHRRLSVRQQETLPGSTLNRMRRFLNWRREMPALRLGEMRFLDVPQDVLGFVRTYDGQNICCLFNLSATDVPVPLDLIDCGEQLHGHSFAAVLEDEVLVVPAHGAWFGASS
ncbi:alpha-glucosidase family protein [Croceicoccus naphthovorans]|uniref:Alpha-glucosidase n=1 Tax=Croceicoccus naphthovorans TaxID=1348774 RepID=A0A0G3XHM8_9SPHN|nr:alpha-glucosidase family protein [Croceicoccus naphthovorans]AKM10104.1 alpha-glucosidase [Croceicoccus naphthovorans]MBB3991162.1 alpha-glucosidase [Croceicoccus naphthovorans]